MLLRFGVENFLSFKEYSEISFLPSKLDDGGYIVDSPSVDAGVLPVLALFGANASGKSNFLKAVRFLRDQVVMSARRGPDEGTGRIPFALDSSMKTHPTRLDCDILIDSVRYQFGFVVDDEQVLEEWLYTYSGNRRSVLYERGVDPSDPWYFGPSLKGPKARIAEVTKPNTLFVSSGAQLNHPVLTSVYSIFRRFTALSTNGQLILQPESELLLSNNEDRVRRILAASDLGVVGFRAIKASEDEELGPFFAPDSGMPKEVRETLQTAKRIKLLHSSAQGSVEFPLSNESLGTQGLIHRLEPILSALKYGNLVIADEFDLHLHPMLTSQLVGLFRNRDSNPKGAQLLCALHDSTIMRELRRDEINLFEKDPVGNSTILSAASLKIRKESDLRSLYESGRIGGVPILGDLSVLAGDSCA